MNQLTSQPTNKLAAATIVNNGIAVLSAGSGLIVRNFWPQWFDVGTWSAGTVFLMGVVPYIVAWFIPDDPQIIMVEQETKK